MSGDSTRPGRVLVVGTLNVDLVWQVPVLPRPGQTILATAVERQFGGKGANQAVAAARQGAAVTLIGVVGDDAEGRCYRDYLIKQGIDVAGLAMMPGLPTGTAHVYVDPGGENLIVVDRGANTGLDVSRLAGLMPQCDVVLLQLEGALEAAVETLRVAGAVGVRSMLNASPVNRAFPWGEHAIDTVIVNEPECGECFELSPNELWDLTDAARTSFLRERELQHVIVTRGAESTLHVSAAGRESVPAYTVQPIDTVGAGDIFAGVLAAQLAALRPWKQSLWHANVAAALSTLALGAQAATPTRAAVEAAVAGARASP